MGRHGGHQGRDLGAADGRGHIVAIDQHLLSPLPAEQAKVEILEQRSHGGGIGRINPLLPHPPGKGAVHRPGVEINEPKPTG